MGNAMPQEFIFSGKPQLSTFRAGSDDDSPRGIELFFAYNAPTAGGSFFLQAGYFICDMLCV